MFRIGMQSRMGLLSAFIFLNIAGSAQTLPPGDAREIVEQQCGGCHVLKVVTSKKASRDQWRVLVDQMVGRGADVPDDKIETLINYLATNFGPAKTDSSKEDDHSKDTHAKKDAVNVNKAEATELTSGLDLSSEEGAAIVAYRKQHGDFKTWQDLNIPGVDIKKIETNKDRITF
jgi:competence ComEA-like helix-hairpin-helix protein